MSSRSTFSTAPDFDRPDDPEAPLGLDPEAIGNPRSYIVCGWKPREFDFCIWRAALKRSWPFDRSQPVPIAEDPERWRLHHLGLVLISGERMSETATWPTSTPSITTGAI